LYYPSHIEYGYEFHHHKEIVAWLPIKVLAHFKQLVRPASLELLAIKGRPVAGVWMLDWQTERKIETE
jgi:hypothetical protein